MTDIEYFNREILPRLQAGIAQAKRDGKDNIVQIGEQLVVSYRKILEAQEKCDDN